MVQIREFLGKLNCWAEKTIAGKIVNIYQRSRVGISLRRVVSKENTVREQIREKKRVGNKVKYKSFPKKTSKKNSY